MRRPTSSRTTRKGATIQERAGRDGLTRRKRTNADGSTRTSRRTSSGDVKSATRKTADGKIKSMKRGGKTYGSQSKRVTQRNIIGSAQYQAAERRKADRKAARRR
jgi:hypothetical protein